MPAHYFLPASAIVSLEDGAQIGVGEVIARIPQEGSKTRDITGGLPGLPTCLRHVSQKNLRFLPKISGTLVFGKETKGKRRLVLPYDGNCRW